MKKIAMYGPGHGHNIEKWLSFFNPREDIELTFIYYGDASVFEDKYCKVKFVKIKSTMSLCFGLRKEWFDLFIVQGAYSLLQSLLLTLLIRKDKMLLVAWGNGILGCFKDKNNKKIIATKALFKMADRIAAPDQLMRDIITYYPKGESKKYDFLWGISIEYHYLKKDKPQKFTTDFIGDLGDKYFIFWPRSILRLSRYDVGIEALAKLSETRPDIIEKIKFVIWTGNTIDKNYLKELECKIDNLGLNKVVDIIIHPFLPDSDIKKIWERADLSVNLIENDGFSTQLGEAFITETPLLVNEIEAYSLVKKRFNLPLKFTPLDVISVAEDIERFYENRYYLKSELDKLRVFSEQNLNYNINFHKLLKDYFV